MIRTSSNGIFYLRYPLMQSSAVVRLEAGKLYYVEGVESNSEGPSHLSVGVQLPNGLLLRPIPGEFLNRVPLITKEVNAKSQGTQQDEKVLDLLNADSDSNEKINGLTSLFGGDTSSPQIDKDNEKINLTRSYLVEPNKNENENQGIFTIFCRSSCSKSL